MENDNITIIKDIYYGEKGDYNKYNTLDIYLQNQSYINDINYVGRYSIHI